MVCGQLSATCWELTPSRLGWLRWPSNWSELVPSRQLTASFTIHVPWLLRRIAQGILLPRSPTRHWRRESWCQLQRFHRSATPSSGPSRRVQYVNARSQLTGTEWGSAHTSRLAVPSHLTPDATSAQAKTGHLSQRLAAEPRLLSASFVLFKLPRPLTLQRP